MLRQYRRHLNLTFIGTDGRISAFDSGPGNTLIDQWVEMQTGRTYDPGGEIGGRGKVVASLAERYLQSPFFRGNVRRSLDRGDFAPLRLEEASLEDGARTLAHVAAASIIKSANFFPETPSIYIVCGGGRLNATLMAEFSIMAERLGSKVLTAEEAGFDGDAMEAEAWAYLAVRSLEGLPLTFPGTTGSGLRSAAVCWHGHDVPQKDRHARRRADPDRWSAAHGFRAHPR